MKLLATLGLGLMAAAAPLGAAVGVSAQSIDPDLANRLQTITPGELAAQVDAARREYQAMSPAQREALQAEARREATAAAAGVSAWWQGLTPEQQAAYLKSLGDLGAAMVPPEVKRALPQ